jgi:hypothetical protein
VKLAIISPHDLELCKLGDIQFVLAQEVTRENTVFYRALSDAGQYIILDHGAFEIGHPAFDYENWPEYMKIAEAVGASEVIAPDVQWDPYQSFDKQLEFARWFRDKRYHDRFKLMAVVWSAGTGDVGYWFGRYKDLVHPDTYGIGKWYESQYADGTRKQIIQGLMQNFNVKPSQLHALGCPHAREIFELRNLVRSMDTGLATKAALQEIELDGASTERIQSVKLQKLTLHEYRTALRNIHAQLDNAHCKE